jgi:FkbM family methyltransferase
MDGYHGSNTHMFELYGWDVLCVEPNPIYAEKCRLIRKNVSDFAVGSENRNGVDFTVFDVGGGNLSAISGLRTDERLVDSHKHLITNKYSIKISVRTLDTIISQQFSHVESIDFVSIDTEGTEIDVLKGFDIQRWNPTLFVIENNFNESTVGDYLASYGYRLDRREQINDFYIRGTN